METKFKVGDKIRYLSTCSIASGEDEVVAVIKDGRIYDTKKLGAWHVFHLDANAELISKGKSVKVLPPRFILQYELDTDPFELFATEKQVRTRIAELAQMPNLKRDSIVVFEIKNARKVQLGTSIKFTK
jgi:hypothetical protein